MTRLIEIVEAAVRDVVGAASLKDSMRSADIRDLLHEVRRRIETAYSDGTTSPTAGFYRFILADADSSANVLHSEVSEVKELSIALFAIVPMFVESGLT